MRLEFKEYLLAKLLLYCKGSSICAFRSVSKTSLVSPSLPLVSPSLPLVSSDWSGMLFCSDLSFSAGFSTVKFSDSSFSADFAAGKVSGSVVLDTFEDLCRGEDEADLFLSRKCLCLPAGGEKAALSLLILAGGRLGA